jgi:hypothetical protein
LNLNVTEAAIETLFQILGVEMSGDEETIL